MFAFFRPELLVHWLAYLPPPEGQGTVNEAAPGTLLARMRQMPQLITE